MKFILFCNTILAMTQDLNNSDISQLDNSIFTFKDVLLYIILSALATAVLILGIVLISTSFTKTFKGLKEIVKKHTETYDQIKSLYTALDDSKNEIEKNVTSLTNAITRLNKLLGDDKSVLNKNLIVFNKTANEIKSLTEALNKGVEKLDIKEEMKDISTILSIIKENVINKDTLNDDKDDSAQSV